MGWGEGQLTTLERLRAMARVQNPCRLRLLRAERYKRGTEFALARFGAAIGGIENANWEGPGHLLD
jgi:hypothetical protein